MSGTPLQEFTDVMRVTGPAWATGPEQVVNEGVLHNYTLARIRNAHDITEMVQGGDQITDEIYFDVKDTYQRYDPNIELTYDIVQSGTTWTINWSFATAHVAWTKQEVGLNKGGLTKKYRVQVYKRLARKKHQNLWTNICNKMDAEFWAPPSFSTMESSTPTTPRVPYSIPVFVNESSDAEAGLSTYITGVPVGGSAPVVGDGWAEAANIMGIDPATNVKWMNQQEDYAFASDTRLNAAQIFAPMSNLYWKTRFDQLPKNPQYSDKASSPHVIMTQRQGLVNYEYALRSNQDEFRGMGATSGQDPAYSGPTFRGIPMEYIAALDSAVIYPTGEDATDSVTMGTWDDTTQNSAGTMGYGAVGPRYYFLNLMYMKWVVHQDNYCVMTDPFMPSGQPFSRVQVMDLWNNFYATSRMRHGILHPGGVDVTSV